MFDGCRGGHAEQHVAQQQVRLEAVGLGGLTDRASLRSTSGADHVAEILSQLRISDRLDAIVEIPHALAGSHGHTRRWYWTAGPSTSGA